MLLRYVNVGSQTHSMSLLGGDQAQSPQDGHPLQLRRAVGDGRPVEPGRHGRHARDDADRPGGEARAVRGRRPPGQRRPDDRRPAAGRLRRHADLPRHHARRRATTASARCRPMSPCRPNPSDGTVAGHGHRRPQRRHDRRVDGDPGRARRRRRRHASDAGFGTADDRHLRHRRTSPAADRRRITHARSWRRAA